MKRFTLSLLVLIFLTLQSQGQEVNPRIYSNPSTPPREVLDRLNLKVGWQTFIPVEQRRDGLFTVQFQDQDTYVKSGPDTFTLVLKKEIFVQTQTGLIVALNGETGEVLWRNRVSSAYRPTHALGFNKTMVFIVNGAVITALDRARGNQLWEFSLPNAPSAAPVADDQQVYLSLGSNHIYYYRILSALPGTEKKKLGLDSDPMDSGNGKFDLKKLATAQEDLSKKEMYRILEYYVPPPPPPLLTNADRIVDHFLEETPLQTSDKLLFPCADGGALGVAKSRPADLYFFPTRGPVTAAAGQHREMAYLASQDQNLTALSIVTGRALWRMPSPGPFLRKPDVNDESVFVTPERSGLYRVNRKNGDVIWNNPTANRFLATNPKFVYALDSACRLMVLDAKRGTYLSGYDTRDFVFPIANEATDRFYLAANNGLIVCLHDKEYRVPLALKTPEPPAIDPVDNIDKNPEPKP